MHRLLSVNRDLTDRRPTVLRLYLAGGIACLCPLLIAALCLRLPGLPRWGELLLVSVGALVFLSCLTCCLYLLAELLYTEANRRQTEASHPGRHHPFFCQVRHITDYLTRAEQATLRVVLEGQPFTLGTETDRAGHKSYVVRSFRTAALDSFREYELLPGISLSRLHIIEVTRAGDADPAAVLPEYFKR
ncbi:MAG: hypothetical protein WDA00_04710 [Eubacteriales bacterium]